MRPTLSSATVKGWSAGYVPALAASPLEVWYDIGTFDEYERALKRLDDEPRIFGH